MEDKCESVRTQTNFFDVNCALACKMCTPDEAMGESEAEGRVAGTCIVGSSIHSGQCSRFCKTVVPGTSERNTRKGLGLLLNLPLSNLRSTTIPDNRAAVSYDLISRLTAIIKSIL